MPYLKQFTRIFEQDPPEDNLIRDTIGSLGGLARDRLQCLNVRRQETLATPSALEGSLAVHRSDHVASGFLRDMFLFICYFHLLSMLWNAACLMLHLACPQDCQWNDWDDWGPMQLGRGLWRRARSLLSGCTAESHSWRPGMACLLQRCASMKES